MNAFLFHLSPTLPFLNNHDITLHLHVCLSKTCLTFCVIKVSSAVLPVGLKPPIWLVNVYWAALLQTRFFFQYPGCQQIGFLLGSCGVSWALTSEACLKSLPKDDTGHVTTFKGKSHLFNSINSGTSCLKDLFFNAVFASLISRQVLFFLIEDELKSIVCLNTTSCGL